MKNKVKDIFLIINLVILISCFVIDYETVYYALFIVTGFVSLYFILIQSRR